MDLPPHKQRRPDHRGAKDNPLLFAQRFVRDRISGFEKDMGICLTGIPSPSGGGITHAYFPALGTCCGMLEYLTALFIGKTEGLGHKDLQKYARLFLPAEYTDDTVEVLFKAFRHSVAHRSIAS